MREACSEAESDNEYTAHLAASDNASGFVMPDSESPSASPILPAGRHGQHSDRSSSSSSSTSSHRKRKQQKQRTAPFNARTAALLSILAVAPSAMAQGNCISLKGSTQCPAFSSSSISTTNDTLLGYFPFLRFVSSTETFDDQLKTYISTSYAQEKYRTLLGCGNVDLTKTTDLYARFTTTVICNAIIQNSRFSCNLSPADSRPVCATTCAQQAGSEAIIVANNDLCSNPGPDAEKQIRADFTNCALPASSLSGTCIEGAANESDNCGFGNSTIGLCQYCSSGGQNSTETCCYNSQAEQRCAGVKLPTITALMTFSTAAPTSTPTASPSSTAAASSSSKGLSGGAIAGIVIGSLAGAAILAALLFLLLLCLRRRRGGSQNGSIFNQPSPAKQKPNMAYTQPTPVASPGYEVLPGGRIARMSALEGESDSPPRGDGAMLSAASGGAGYATGRSRRHHESSSDEYSPISNNQGGVLRPPPTARRNGSLSSGSALGYDDPQSPRSGSGGDMSSPQGMTSQQSEQLPFFKDYYSTDEIHPGDKVATLWAYQPRAGDEFALERGDMLKVVGIWDDGWATGVLIDEQAEDWDAKRNALRDSGVSNTSGRRDESPNVSGEIKAFPLVCVCLPDHWRKTIDGDGSTETGSTAQHPGGNI
ncbi:uncharacterized protein BP5553_04282 [Venustampulla echinocandica]|uniref:SH3 domain-containing protein n=1 Tax=Venustampulla echinocandica TaxID=2656787 RepID=A0A370TWN8_9HELO|nr:uncharacterized protein BP5553_04282 [Venustampulla echinocandica]RDL39942.1 hypothetical protein BP5553_04282 [Venustampulla echinocandica]